MKAILIDGCMSQNLVRDSGEFGDGQNSIKMMIQINISSIKSKRLDE